MQMRRIRKHRSHHEQTSKSLLIEHWKRKQRDKSSTKKIQSKLVKDLSKDSLFESKSKSKLEFEFNDQIKCCHNNKKEFSFYHKMQLRTHHLNSPDRASTLRMLISRPLRRTKRRFSSDVIRSRRRSHTRRRIRKRKAPEDRLCNLGMQNDAKSSQCSNYNNSKNSNLISMKFLAYISILSLLISIGTHTTINWQWWSVSSNQRPFRHEYNQFAFAQSTTSSTASTASTTAQSSSTISQSGDPRPTIYSGHISLALLLSAHSSMGAEMVGSASHQIQTIFEMEKQRRPDFIFDNASISASLSTLRPQLLTGSNDHYQTTSPLSNVDNLDNLQDQDPDEETSDELAEKQKMLIDSEDKAFDMKLDEMEKKNSNHLNNNRKRRKRRQIFQSKSHRSSSSNKNIHPVQHCSQVNPNALYAGMGAIWASHQANLVADSHFTIGTYVYDSCNDADVGQRQSVRIVSNLNAFQQTTCESPRGSPISLTIAHGDDQVKAIHLLTSFRVPVISTKEHFAQDAYSELSGSQKKYLFSTAPSSRHLANGALRFAKRVSAKLESSPKLPNSHNKRASRNGLVVISRNLPQPFVNYLIESAHNLIHFEILATKSPIDQIKSIQKIESIFLDAKRTGSGNGASESQQSTTRIAAPNSKQEQQRLKRRSMSSDLDITSGGGGDSDNIDSSSNNNIMLSPTIVMFINPDEAIDLITQLRNQMAEVSKYYTLIIVTREDMTPALKTIFQKGGSSLCSGKAFYTISPKPDDMSEFSRYFRDTVQIEGETSDHPLICEFAKHASSTRIATDYDDVAAEPVIKAVWAAAAAFKSVHKRECGAVATASSSSTTLNSSNFYKAPSTSTTGPTSGQTTATTSSVNQQAGNDASKIDQQIRSLKSRQSNNPTGSKSPHAECMMKMSKSMSQLVQRALKKINVKINSTGLQSLDGFNVNFDEFNELASNRFSIKHINKECDIEEIGEYSGHMRSQLILDDSAVAKSLESTLPDAWPVTTPAPIIERQSPQVKSATHGSVSDGINLAGLDPVKGDSGVNSADGSNSDNNNQGDSAGNPSWIGEQPASSSTQTFRKKKVQREQQPVETDDENSPDPNSSLLDSNSARHKTTKRSKSSDNKQHNRVSTGGRTRSAPILATSLGIGSKSQIGLTDSPEPSDSTTTVSSNENPIGDDVTTPDPLVVKPMRKLMPYPATEGNKLNDWLPKQELTTESSLSTTISPITSKITHRITKQRNVNSTTTTTTSTSTSTTKAPSIHSTLPESGGNTDLEIPALAPISKSSKVPPKKPLAPPIETAVTSESSDYVTMTSASSSKKQSQPKNSTQSMKSSETNSGGMNTASTTMSSVTLKPYGRPQGFSFDMGSNYDYNQQGPRVQMDPTDTNNYLPPFRNLDFSPVALSSSEAPNLPLTQSMRPASGGTGIDPDATIRPSALPISESQKLNRSKLRSHLWRIYNSWFGLAILVANIIGAILTLYVLTYLLMKNCDGSLDRENQSVRSMHLLAIIVVFFGSTLFIVSPTPGLCLLRASWHNFALVLLFGCLLSQTMQIRSIRTLGLGGRPNRLNQFLNLVFLVGVQVSFELQRWKYESANYLNFVNQYFGSPESDHKKLMILGNAIANQFNPLDSFNDLVTPVSIQVSEKYQNLLQDYCIQQTDDFLQSQIYLCIIVGLSIFFSCLTRNYGTQNHGLLGANSRTLRSRFMAAPSAISGARSTSSGATMTRRGGSHHGIVMLPTITSGKLVASEHEANLNIASSTMPSSSQSTFQYASGAGQGLHHGAGLGTGNEINFIGLDTGIVFIVSLINGAIYLGSILIHIYGHNSSNRDLISSVTMVLIAFVTLIGIFLPILHQIHRFDTRHLKMASGPSSRRKLNLNGHQSNNQLSSQNNGHQLSSAFTMFPEFSPTGLKKPTSATTHSSLASLSGESSNVVMGSTSRKPFAATKESRRKMGFTLANLAIDQQLKHSDQNDNNGEENNGLRGMGFYDPDVREALEAQFMDSSMINMKLNEALLNEADNQQQSNQTKVKRLSRNSHLNQPNTSSNSNANSHSKNNNNYEKRLIMLDVDPCCPKHGHGLAGRSKSNSSNCH